LLAAAAGVESFPVLAVEGIGFRLTMAERDDEVWPDDWFGTIRLPSIGGNDPADGMRFVRGTAAAAAGTRSTLTLVAVAARDGSMPAK